MVAFMFVILMFGLFVMYLGDQSKDDGSGIVIAGAIIAVFGLCGIDAIVDVDSDAREELRGSDRFKLVVEQFPKCNVRPNNDGSKIEIICEVGVE